MNNIDKQKNQELSAEEIETYLREWMEQNKIKEINTENRYFLKEAGIHYVIENMNLNEAEQEELKKLISERVCLEEVKATEMIPACYLKDILKDLPDDVRELELAKMYITATSVSLSKFRLKVSPAPFNTSTNGPYIGVSQKGIQLLVEMASHITGKSIMTILNTEERLQKFNAGGGVIKNFLDKHPAMLGLRRN